MSGMVIVINRLTNDPAVKALVSPAKVFPVEIRQGEHPPAISVNELTRRDDPLLAGGASGYYRQRVMVECVSLTDQEIVAISNAVFNALQGVTKASIAGFTDVDILEEGGPGSGRSDDRSLYVWGMDWSVQYRV